MIHFKRIVFIILLFSAIFLSFNSDIFAVQDNNYIVLNDHEINFKYSNMVNLEFIKFNSIEKIIKKDITYKSINNKDIKLDILFPEVKLSKNYPVVIYIHGGGFIRGDKDEIYDLKPLVDEWHQRGWAVISVNYRLLLGDNMYPDNYDDVMDAIDWVFTNKDKYNFNTNKISLIGHSAGGNLALLSGLNHENIDSIVSLAGPTKLFGKNTFELRKKMMSFVNSHEFAENKMEKASPINYLKQESPPIMLVHGTIDNFVPFEQSEIFYNKAKSIGAKCKFIKIEGGGHILELSYLPRMPELKNRITDFMEKSIEGS